MYSGGAKQEEGGFLAEMEKQLGLDEPQTFEVWTHNWDAVRVFCAMVTQWQVAYGGYVGLRYEALQVVFEAIGIEPKKRAEVFSSLRILESEALSAINEKR